jgi:hypothetical protein
VLKLGNFRAGLAAPVVVAKVVQDFKHGATVAALLAGQTQQLTAKSDFARISADQALSSR